LAEPGVQVDFDVLVAAITEVYVAGPGTEEEAAVVCPIDAALERRVSGRLRDAAEIRRRAADIFGALLDGSLKIGIAGRYTLDNVEEAHAAYEERRMVGKPVLDIINN